MTTLIVILGHIDPVYEAYLATVADYGPLWLVLQMAVFIDCSKPERVPK